MAAATPVVLSSSTINGSAHVPATASRLGKVTAVHRHVFHLMGDVEDDGVVGVLARSRPQAARRMLCLVAMLGFAAGWGMPAATAAEPPASPAAEKKLIKLPGVIGDKVIESTPLLYQGRAIMFHSRRPMATKRRAEIYLILTDAATGKELARFGQGHSLGCALVEGDKIHVFAAEQPEGAAWFQDIQHFWSSDLKTWNRELAIRTRLGRDAAELLRLP